MNSNYTSAVKEIIEIKNSIVCHTPGCSKQLQRLSDTVKMRLGARENADQGILLAATTEHFDRIGKSLGRLSVHRVSCADNLEFTTGNIYSKS